MYIHAHTSRGEPKDGGNSNLTRANRPKREVRPPARRPARAARVCIRVVQRARKTRRRRRRCVRASILRANKNARDTRAAPPSPRPRRRHLAPALLHRRRREPRMGFKKKPSWKMPPAPPAVAAHRFNFLYTRAARKVPTTFPCQSLLHSRSHIRSSLVFPRPLSFPYRRAPLRPSGFSLYSAFSARTRTTTTPTHTLYRRRAYTARYYYYCYTCPLSTPCLPVRFCRISIECGPPESGDRGAIAHQKTFLLK